MRRKSHHLLGQYLTERYMINLPKRYIRAFLIGCIEPDRNPTTYLKGSLRCQWLRGHNWGNARNYIHRISSRLENRKRLRLWDYYTMGKLIHYTADAFTSAHNMHFGADLTEHRKYELALEQHFLNYLSANPRIWTDARYPVIDTICRYHRDYLCRPTNVHTDSRFAIIVCCMVMTRLFDLS